MKRLLKFLHTLGAVGLLGSVVIYLLLLANGPPVADTPEYGAHRAALGVIADRVLLPSLAVVLMSGLFSIALFKPFRDAGWVWAKLLSGVLVFEGTLGGLHGPATRAARLFARKAGEIDVTRLDGLLRHEWGAAWVLLILAVANIALAIWRPRFRRRSKAASGPGTQAAVGRQKAADLRAGPGSGADGAP